MFTGDNENVLMSGGDENFSLFDDFIDRECLAHDRIVTFEAAVGAIIHTLVRDIEWRKEFDRLSKPLHRKRMHRPGELFKIRFQREILSTDSMWWFSITKEKVFDVENRFQVEMIAVH